MGKQVLLTDARPSDHERHRLRSLLGAWGYRRRLVRYHIDRPHRLIGSNQLKFTPILHRGLPRQDHVLERPRRCCTPTIGMPLAATLVVVIDL